MRTWLVEGAPNIRRRVLLGTVFLVPLLVLRDLNDPIELPKLSLLIVAVSIAGALRIGELLQVGSWDAGKKLLVPATALALPLTIGWIFSPYKGWALFGIYPRYLGLVPYLIVIAFGILLADAFRDDASPIARALMAAGALVGAYAVIQLIGLDPFEWSVGRSEAPDRYVVSTLGNPNFAGAWLAMALPVAAGLVMFEPDRRALWRAALLLIFVGWLGAGSEIAWVAGAAGLAIFAGWTVAQRWQLARLAATLVAGLMAAVIVGAVVAAIAGLGAERLATAERRGEWWRASLRMSADSPLVGRGPNAFALEHARYRSQQDAEQVGLDITDDPHSVPLSLLTGAGVGGLIGFLILVWWVVKRGFSLDGGASLAAAFLGAAVVYLVQSLGSIDTVALRTMLWTSLAGLVISSTPVAKKKVNRSKRAQRVKRAEPLSNPAGVFSAIVVGVAGVLFGANLFINDAQFAHANDIFREGDLEGAQKEFESALSGRDEIAYRRAYGNLLGDIAVGLEGGGRPFIEEARAQFSFVEETPHLNSIVDNARTFRDWGPFGADVGYDAVALYAKATRLDPRNPGLLAEAAAFFLEQQAYEELSAALQPHVRQFQQAGLWGSLALAEAHLGDVDQAREAIDTALQLDPAEANALAAREILEGQP